MKKSLNDKNLLLPPLQRNIRPNDNDLYEWYRKQKLGEADKEEYTKNLRTENDHTDELDEPQECRRVSWRMDKLLTCNNFHELTIDRIFETPEQDYNITYLRYVPTVWIEKFCVGSI